MVPKSSPSNTLQGETAASGPRGVARRAGPGRVGAPSPVEVLGAADGHEAIGVGELGETAQLVVVLEAGADRHGRNGNASGAGNGNRNGAGSGTKNKAENGNGNGAGAGKETGQGPRIGRERELGGSGPGRTLNWKRERERAAVAPNHEAPLLPLPAGRTRGRAAQAALVGDSAPERPGGKAGRDLPGTC